MLKNSNYATLYRLGCGYCVLQLLLRFVLSLLSAKDISWNLIELLPTLFLGLVYDIIVVLCLLAPMALLILPFKGKFISKGWGKGFYLFFLGTFFFSTLFTVVSEICFWEEFHTRFNFIAVDYLVYSQELFKNIFEAYPVIPIVSIILALSIIGCYLFNKKYPTIICELPLKARLLQLGQYALGMVLGLTLMSTGMSEKVSANRFNQEIAGNGIFTMFHAFFHNELDYDSFYAHMTDTEIVSALQAKLALDQGQLLNAKDSQRQIVNNTALSEKKPNIVIITVESLSASFTSFVDKSQSLTPYLDALREQSYSFDRVYATGTRTVRGLEALSLCIPPTPGQSVVRRPASTDLFNSSTPLKERGYKAEFIYGGYGYFDNMNDFFASNGFGIYDRTDIPKEDVYFETVWGVADEIIFKKALERMDQQTPQQPVMQLILTTTNHSPYTFPKDSIPEPQGKRESVVKYTDWSIHKFLEAAKTKPWFDNTVFIIIADHNASVAGRAGLPIHKYHIPCIVYAPKLIPPGHNQRLMSQIDVLPTLYGMLGLNYTSKNMGYDVNKLPEGKERVFISTYQELGYVSGDTLVVLTPGKKVVSYKINDFATSNYTKITPNSEIVKDAITWYQGASYLYKNNLLKK